MSLFEVDGWGLDKKRVKSFDGKRKSKKNQKSEHEEDNTAALKLGIKIEKKTEKKRIEKNVEESNSECSYENENVVGSLKGKKRSNAEEPNKEDEDESRFNKKPRSEIPPEVSNGIDPSKLTPLQRKMLNKLSGSRFRWINEQLYTTDSSRALEMMKKQPELYEEYHRGFASQVESWPENPVDVFTRELVYRGVNKMINAPGGLPGINIDGERKVVVSDMGCGEANLAINIDKFMFDYNKNQKEALKKFRKKFGHAKDVVLKNKKLAFQVHSFDLKQINDKITVADIKNVPLGNETCSVVIFCLSLMGTNFLEFIKEADRILIKGGELWITEIKSRLSDPKCTEFIKAIESLGFKLRNFDDANKMFTKFEFYKPLKKVKTTEIDQIRQGKAEGVWLLKPCIYKRR